MPQNDTAASITRLVKSLLRKERSSFSPFVVGTFVAEETGNRALSVIKVAGQNVRHVRKAKHIGNIAAQEQCLCIQGHGQGLIIIAIITGDVTDLT